MDNNHDTPLGFWGSEAQEVLSKNFPIHKACLDGDAVTLTRACALASVEQLTAEDQFYSWTPIHWAAYFGKNECVNGLLRCGVSVNQRTSKFQQTPAHIAAFGGHPDTLFELLKSGADFHARDYMGEIPLHKAARVGNIECIKLLINNGTQPSICNNEGATAGAISRNLNFIEVSHLLEIACSQMPNSHQQMPVTNGHHLVNGTSGSHLLHSNGNANGLNGHSNGHSNRKRTFDDESMPIIKRARMTGIESSPLQACANIAPDVSMATDGDYFDGESSTMVDGDYNTVPPPEMSFPSAPNNTQESSDDSPALKYVMALQGFPCTSEEFEDKDFLAEALGQTTKTELCNDSPHPDFPPSVPHQTKSNHSINALAHNPRYDEDDVMDCYSTTEASPATPGVTHLEDDFARPPSPGMDMKLFREDDLQLWGYYHGYGDTAECIPEEESIPPSRTNGLVLRGTQARGWH